MLIAKSFYGKKAKQGIQRLQEGKYRISSKIVFVRVNFELNLILIQFTPIIIFFLQLLRDRHVMVRVGGGWDTLEHFLSRHGADEQVTEKIQISPSDLLPTDTRCQKTESRTKGSPTSDNGSSPNSSPSKVFSRSPSMSQLPPLRRAVSITPVSVSRRSSTSSPEPWTGHSSGDSGCGNCERGSITPRREGQLNITISTKKRTPRRSSLCGPSPALSTQSVAMIGEVANGRMPSARRSLITASNGKLKPLNRSTLGLNNAMNGHENGNGTKMVNNTSRSNKDLSPPSSGKTSSTTSPIIVGGKQQSMIPTPKRYINYLSSSQHIKPPTATITKSSSQSTPSSTPNSQLIKTSGSSSMIPALITDHHKSFNHGVNGHGDDDDDGNHSEDGKTNDLNNKNRRSSLKAF